MKHYLLLFLFLLGCASPPIRTQEGDFQEEAHQYLKEYLNILDNKVLRPNGRFELVDDLSYFDGYCIAGDPWIIDIQSANWFASSHTDRRALIFHELTHCMLKARHTNDINHFMYGSSSIWPDAQEVTKQVEKYKNKKLWNTLEDPI